MFYILFFISLLGTVAFRNIRVFGEIHQRRKCTDDIMEILGLTKKERTAVRVIVPEYFHSENTWTEGEVPWNITDDNDTIPVTAKVPTFDPLEPCSIGHLFI